MNSERSGTDTRSAVDAVAPAARDTTGHATPSVSYAAAASALQAAPYGGADDGSLGFAITPALRAAISPVIAALRWSTVMFGVLYAAPKAQDGDLAVVVSTTVCLFVTSWRTVRPLRLDSPSAVQRTLAHTDALVIGAAVGVSNGFVSPFAFCLLAVGVVAAFGWGLRVGAGATLVGAGAALAVAEATNAAIEYTTQSAVGFLLVLAAAVGFAAFTRRRLLAAERRRVHLAGRVDHLTETNDLLQILNRLARTLPTALDSREAVASVRSQLVSAFQPQTMLVLARGDDADTWIPQVVEGMTAKPAILTVELPMVLSDIERRGAVARSSDLGGAGLSPDSAVGLYAALETRGRTVGLLALEHGDPERYTARDERMLAGLAEVVALTLDNARWFSRLRTLGADEERARIARDLHDRLGQWLTYISLELERISASDGDPQLVALRGDVQRAIDELRDTLRQLHTTITEELTFARAARELLDGFTQRSGVSTTLRADDPEAALAVPVENELLRILQEALHNIDKHAKADHVDVVYDIGPRTATLVISDDGRGFDPAKGVRGSAYGLVGMRERADVIGATFTLASSIDGGTMITIDIPLETAR